MIQRPVKTMATTTKKVTHTPMKMNRTKVAMIMDTTEIRTATIHMDMLLIMKVMSKVLNVMPKIRFIAPRGQKLSTCTTLCSI